MGYTLIIGELETEITNEGLETNIEHSAKIKKLKKAPAFGEPIDFTNQRWPSYPAWADAMKFVGLYDFMFNKETGLIANHPGCVPINKEHKKIIDKAYSEFYKKYPNAKPGYSTIDNNDENWPPENSYSVRLEWLKFWVDWAVENCKTPVFYNS